MGHVDAADAQSLQILGLRNAIFFRDAVRQIVAAVHADADRELGTAVCLDSHDDLCDKAHPALKAAAVFVCTLVSMRRKELADQISVRRVDLNAVNACFLGNDCAGDELLNHRFDFFRRQCAGLLADHLAGDIRCRNRLLSADQSAGRLVSGMMQLYKQLRVISMYRLHKAGKLCNHVCIGHAQLIGCSDAGLIVDTSDLGDDQTCSAPRAVRIVLDHAGSGFACGLSQRTSHGGHDNAVLDLQVSDLSGSEELLI